MYRRRTKHAKMLPSILHIWTALSSQGVGDSILPHTHRRLSPLLSLADPRIKPAVVYFRNFY